MKYLDLKTAFALMKLVGSKISLRGMKYCIPCEKCGHRLIHTKFHIIDKTLYATNKCEHCDYEDELEHQADFCG